MAIVPGQHDFQARQGSTFREIVEVLDEDDAPIDLAGVTNIRMMVREEPESVGTILNLQWGVDITVLAPSTDGRFQILVLAATMAALTAGSYVYDIEVVNLFGNGDTDPLLAGAFTVTREITRP